MKAAPKFINPAAEAESPAAGLSTHRNTVQLVGRLSGEPQERELPSGDRLVTFRLVVERQPRAAGAHGSRQRVDTLDCVAWAARVRRSALSWPDGSTLEIEGSVRRRFRRTPAGSTSRVEVEVVRARVRR
jgi:single-strand DNA-binding protein